MSEHAAPIPDPSDKKRILDDMYDVLDEHASAAAGIHIKYGIPEMEMYLLTTITAIRLAANWGAGYLRLFEKATTGQELSAEEEAERATELARRLLASVGAMLGEPLADMPKEERK